MNCREAENGLESHRGAELKAGQHLQPLLQQEGRGVGEEFAGLGVRLVKSQTAGLLSAG